jgi:hypothetical protein
MSGTDRWLAVSEDSDKSALPQQEHLVRTFPFAKRLSTHLIAMSAQAIEKMLEVMLQLPAVLDPKCRY